MPRTAAQRVVVIDDNEITRNGLAACLAGHDDIELLAVTDHHGADQWAQRWHQTDVVIVDAGDETNHQDHFPGVGVVNAIRNPNNPTRPLVIVVTGHYLHDGLRHRMRHAGADFFCNREDLRSDGALLALVRHPDLARRGVPEPSPSEAETAFNLGITSAASDVTAFINLVTQHNLSDALDPPDSRVHNRGLRSRRAWTPFRHQAKTIGGIRTVTKHGDPPLRSQDLPSVSQLRRLYQWAARIDPPRPRQP
jgi:CheY-like chemotaxis protein